MPARRRLPTIDEIFRPGGLLSEVLPGYQYRDEQVTIACAIAEAMKEGSPCLVEAGTGVGKSLAYLIPAVLAAAEGKKTVISTYTINLQAQLIEKDIPIVMNLFPQVTIKPAVMKGRQNYLCLQDLDAAETDLFTASD